MRTRHTALAAGLLAIWAAAPAHAATRTPIGAQDDGATLAAGAHLNQALARAHQIGATRWRVIVRGTRGLAAYDAGIRAAHDAGFKIQITLTDYGSMDFVRAALERWHGIAAWSLWNEPDLDIGLAAYRRIHLAGAPLVRRYAPRARLLIGEASPHATSRQLRALDRLPGDGLALHPYQNDQPPTRASKDLMWPTGIGTLPRLERHLRHRIYITEFGYPPARQRWWAAAIRVAGRARAREVIAYQLTPSPGWWDTSLYSAGGQPRAGARALIRMAR